MTALRRQSVYSRLAGYEDTNDAERLAVDPAIRRVVGMPRGQANLAVLLDLSGRWIDAVHQRKPVREIKARLRPTPYS